MTYNALYARQSAERKESISIESQLEYCRFEAKGNPCIEYCDKGFSGKNTDRPAFEKMIKDIRNGSIKKVIVYRLDRISRSILDFANMMKLFDEYGVEFVSSTEKFDTSTPMGRAMLNICIVFAELERETIQKRISDAYTSRSRRGFYMGGRIPYGYRLKKTCIDNKTTSMYEEKPEESRQIKLIYSLYAEQSNSLSDIVRYLYENNIKRLRGGSWTSSYLSSLMANPIYVKADIDIYCFFKNMGTDIKAPPEAFTKAEGCYLYSRKDPESGRTGAFSSYELVPAPHRGFIPSDIWLKCRKRCLENRFSSKNSKDRSSWLVSKVKCKNCGHTMSVRKSSTKHNRYFVCAGKDCRGSGCTVYADVLEKYIENAAVKKLGIFEKLSDKASGSISPKVSEIKLLVEKLNIEIDSLVSKIPSADSTLMKYINEKINEYDTKKAKLQKQLITLYKSKAAENIITDHTERWHTLPQKEKQTVIGILLDVIKISDGNIEIFWNI